MHEPLSKSIPAREVDVLRLQRVAEEMEISFEEASYRVLDIGIMRMLEELEKRAQAKQARDYNIFEPEPEPED